MTRPKIAIAGFQHETNTFAPLPTAYDDFARGGAWPPLTEGPDVIEVFSGLNIPIGGFIDAVAGNCDLVPILWTAAEPSSYVDQDAFDRIARMICTGIAEAGDLDAIYLDLHGAMVTGEFEDGEGELLARIRKITGPDLPIAVSLDLHGNVTPQFADRASVTTIYRTYPHIDMAETGARTYRMLMLALERGKPFARAFRQFDCIIPVHAQSTRREPGRRLYEMLPTLETDGVDLVELALGFPPADIEHCGVSLVAYGSDQAAVDAAADRLHEELSAAEPNFSNPMVPSVDAVAAAMQKAPNAKRPVVLADPQDNPGAGAVGDTTGLLVALIGADATDACLGMLWDPALAAEAHKRGVGAEFDALIGGKVAQPDVSPVAARVRVEQLSDGKFTFAGPMYGGAHADLGAMARLRILAGSAGVQVVIGSARTQNADQEIFRHIGIEPSEQKIVAVKSSVHFLADYEPIAEEVIFVDAPGANPCQISAIPYRKLRNGVRLGPGGPAFDGAGGKL